MVGEEVVISLIIQVILKEESLKVKPLNFLQHQKNPLIMMMIFLN